MEVDKMDENDWKYHGEGNKSLVVSHLSRVLRLLKYPAEDSENPPQTPEQAFRQLQNIVDFCSNVMSRLLGEEFIHSGEVVKLPLEFVRQLSIKVQHHRPVWRCDKVMDIYSGCALCLPNLTSPLLHQPTHTPPLCIEIKPKCGFLPSSKLVSKEVKTKVCRFCMHQHYKVANGKWKRRSLYCPLDLFSGNRQRMHFAIRHLIEEPQNNFKIFKGGQCIYSSKEGSDDSPDLNSLLHHLRPYVMHGNNRINSHMTGKAVLNDFIQVLVNALLSSRGGDAGVVTDRRGEGRSACEASLFNKERIRHGQHLPDISVLSRILQTQMLDTLDIEGLYPLYRRVEQHLQEYPKESLPGDAVHQYCVAMTAKDCSIMVSLVPCTEEEEEDDEGPPAFSHSVSILDLDPKPFDSIPRQLRLDQKIVSFYTKTGGSVPKASSLPVPGIFMAAEREDCTLVFHPV
uniref:Inositol-pentakisphosphate 2-kinase n=1 Tax=Cynoglossus semilaevis TaxID=244447 RepID=A0A3P8W5X6_CYNSE